MDVEGSEMLALEGGESVLQTSVRTIFLSTHSQELRRECQASLRTLGFDVRPEHPGDSLEETDEIVAVK